MIVATIIGAVFGGAIVSAVGCDARHAFSVHNGTPDLMRLTVVRVNWAGLSLAQPQSV